MYFIEPYYSWRELYIASEDELSPFFGREYSEFDFTHAIYDYLIHPQWDEIGSPTLYIKILYANYDLGFCVIELLGEWNDCLNNDIMFLKRNIVEVMVKHGINKYILIGENILNFHYSDDSYYQEWFEDIEDGWIVGLDFRDHVVREFETANLDYYIGLGGELDMMEWRTFHPVQLFEKVNSLMRRRLNP